MADHAPEVGHERIAGGCRRFDPTVRAGADGRERRSRIDEPISVVVVLAWRAEVFCSCLQQVSDLSHGQGRIRCGEQSGGGGDIWCRHRRAIGVRVAAVVAVVQRQDVDARGGDVDPRAVCREVSSVVVGVDGCNRHDVRQRGWVHRRVADIARISGSSDDHYALANGVVNGTFDDQ